MIAVVGIRYADTFFKFRLNWSTDPTPTEQVIL